jgi:cytochrome c5
MKNLNIFFATATLLAFAYCKSTKTASSSSNPPAAFAPAEKQMQVAQNRWPNTTAEELKQGHTIFTTKCTECHKNYEITGFSEKKWLHEIDDMSPKAKLSPEEKLQLTKHILSYREAYTVAKAK